ncbi:unnamed protein product [Owenia fusiformis]|uniref:Uncharacterized protein n=1 Tax=Owenia fusiformis TaxID=6347 RepID=A0A8J1V230_OWEFU|nr:unnamed protein product [Owenia fusiformis]
MTNRNRKKSSKDNTDCDEMNELKTRLDEVNTTVQNTDDNIEDLKKTVDDLKNENLFLREILEVMEGRIWKIEHKQDETDDAIDDIRVRSMKMNLIFHGIDKPDIDEHVSKIRSVLVNDMKIPKEFVHPHKPLDGQPGPDWQIQIDVAHPIGQGQGVIPMVAKFTDRRAVEKIMSYAHNLKGSRISVSRQLPDTLRDRRSAQIPMLKKLKSEAIDNRRDPREVSLHQATLKVRGVKVDPHFDEKPLQIPITDLDPNIDDTSTNHTNVISHSGTSIQGHVAKAKTTKQAATVIGRLYKSRSLARASHHSYAYRVPGNTGELVEGFSDDGVWGIGSDILNLMKSMEITNGVIIMTKWSKGPLNKHNHASYMNQVKDCVKLGNFN